MQWVASTLHTTSEHGVSSITTADAHTSAGQQSTELTPPPRRFKWTCPFRAKDEIWFLRVCHHISTGLYKAKCWFLHDFREQCEASATYRVFAICVQSQQPQGRVQSDHNVFQTKGRLKTDGTDFQRINCKY
jgi:hypothetical protein